RPRAEGLVVAALGEPLPRGWRQLDGHAAGEELRVELGDELVHHALDRLGRERAELDHRVEAVSELGGEETLERLLPLVLVRRVAEADRRGGQDRKSTRLNSSHLGISYAVFCLKKKK